MAETKKMLTHYLKQLKIIVSKVPPTIYHYSLSDGMFSLEMHAKIASNFALRGYCPLLNVETVSFYKDEDGEKAILNQIDETVIYLENAPDINKYDDSKVITDKAGFAEVKLCQSEFINMYIVPNLLFHMSMVYAIAKANGAELGKGDFGGLHVYPKDFSFIK